MKAFLYLTALVLLSLLPGCSGSDVYRGAWKAMDREGHKCNLSFAAKSFTIQCGAAKPETYGYTQHSVKIENSTRSYGIELKDGRAFRITFPLPGNADKGLISLETGEALYTIGRTDYVAYNELLRF